MKQTIFLLSTFFVATISFSQKKNLQIFSFSNFREITVHFPKTYLQKSSTSKQDNIHVLDWRADSTSIGFYGANYLTATDLCGQITNYLAPLLNLPGMGTSANNEIFVCIRKLWTMPHFTSVKGRWTAGIVWKADCFKKEDGRFTYLCSSDTTIKMMLKKWKTDVPDLMSICLNELGEKMNLALNDPTNSNATPDMNEYRFPFKNIPILNDSIKRKGLYMTYKQFLQNTPSNVEFELEKGKLTDALRAVDATGNYQLVRNLWGFCDGKNMFIKSGEKYYPLSRVNNTFYFFGSRQLQKNVYNDPLTASLLNVSTGTNRKITVYSLSESAYQLDIANGNFY